MLPQPGQTLSITGDCRLGTMEDNSISNVQAQQPWNHPCIPSAAALESSMKIHPSVSSCSSWTMMMIMMNHFQPSVGQSYCSLCFLIQGRSLASRTSSLGWLVKNRPSKTKTFSSCCRWCSSPPPLSSSSSSASSCDKKKFDNSKTGTALSVSSADVYYVTETHCDDKERVSEGTTRHQPLCID